MVPGSKGARYFMWSLLLLTIASTSFSQAGKERASIFFYQLNTAHGLSDNYIWDMCMDKSGNLWIGSGEGLNMFNGRTVVKFFKEEYPQLQSDYTRELVCDDFNRVWVLCNGGLVSMIDENRKFHKISLYKNDKPVAIRRILHTKALGVLLFTEQGFFSLTKATEIPSQDSLSNDLFSPVKIEGFDTLQAKRFSRIESVGEDSYIFGRPDGFFRINFESKKVEKKYAFTEVSILGKGPGDDVLAYSETKPELQFINLKTEEVTLPLKDVQDQFGKTLVAPINNARMITPDILLITTQLDGMYLFNSKTNSLMNYRHDAADPSTIVNEWPNIITVGNNGWVFIGATPNGISYFKSDAVIGQRTIFRDKQGDSYDGHVNSIIAADNNTFYIGAGNNLLRWSRTTNATTFLDYASVNDLKMKNHENASHLQFDNLGRLWFSTNTHGLFILNNSDKAIKNLQFDTTKPNSLPSLRVRDIKLGPDNFMWLGTDQGVCRVDPKTFKIDYLNSSAISKLNKLSCIYLFFADKDNLWIATGSGLWHYTLSNGSLQNFNEKNGFIYDNVFCINKDKNENLYVGTERGLQIFLQNGKTKLVTQKDGLMNSRVEALMLDKENRMWIGNDVGIACFSIADSSLRYFDETYGLSIQGFRLASYCQTNDGELVWGTERGILYFYPDELYNYKTDLRVNITRIESRKIVTNLTQSDTYHLSANDNYVTFHFSAIEFLTQLRTFYEYKLEGLDADWIKVVNQDFVRYSSLPPGKYVFKLRASNDGKNWKNSENTITVNIAKPLWQSTWFRLLGISLSIMLIWYVISFYRKKQIEQQEKLETQVVINYFASRINSYQKTDDILWNVAKHCISRLHFEDCVIYLLDEERNVLVQKAAYGPKMARDFGIHEPIEIPVGRGIVGTVARTGKPELIGNTELDKRYIVDDARRYSEVAVPLMIDNKVIGVIDSEHSKRNFFNQRHLNILSTIAVLCANQIQRSNAEEEKQKAKIEVLENKQKVTESRLQSLRLQMNPHFLFNALNSIQQMILANEELVATRFLSRFSKLLRAILVNSDKETVTLKEELEILNLYVELEARRFKDSFQYSIKCDNDIDEDEIKIPTLLIQPFVENAIWHGLMHKEGDRRLDIHFSESNNFLTCSIQDNGVGRKKSEETKKMNGQDRGHISKGIKVSLERLKTIRNPEGIEGSLNITDLYNEAGTPTGTRVEINFPIQN